MPMHDWTKVVAGVYHSFHQGWNTEIERALNDGLLPKAYYALQDQAAAGFEPDVLTLHDPNAEDGPFDSSNGGVATANMLRTRPQTRFTAETEGEFYRRKKSSIVIRHVTDDRIVAMLEIVSPGNKSSRNSFHAFVEKACSIIEKRIHLLIVDPFPPGPRDPNGIHAAIWEELQDDPFHLPADEPLTLAAYECALTTRAYVETYAVGNPLPDMPLFLEPNGCVMIPLEATYESTFSHMPQRWRSVLAPSE